MEVGDWVLADVGRNWSLSYIDSFSADEETLHITRIAKTTNGKPVWVGPVPAICHKSLVGTIRITIPPEEVQAYCVEKFEPKLPPYLRNQKKKERPMRTINSNGNLNKAQYRRVMEKACRMNTF